MKLSITLKGLAGKAIGELEKTFEDRLPDLLEMQIPHLVAKATGELEKTFEDRLPKLIEEAAKAAYAVATGKVTDLVVDTIQLALPSSGTIGISILDLAFDDFTGRVDTIQEYMKNPPDLTNRDELFKMITTVGASSVSINGSARVAFLIASSNVAEVRGSLTWDTEDFLGKLDHVIVAFKKFLG